MGLCPNEWWNLVIHTKEFRLFEADSRELSAGLGQRSNITDFYFGNAPWIIL